MASAESLSARIRGYSYIQHKAAGTGNPTVSPGERKDWFLWFYSTLDSFNQ